MVVKALLSILTLLIMVTTYGQHAYNSVLSTGKWYRFKISKTGVYKLDKSFINKLGIPQDVNPKTIKIYGHGGQMLPLQNSLNPYLDLPENAIFVAGESDGVLNNDDYILFYAIGNEGWNEENLTHLNLYSNETYYYITYGGNNGKRINFFQQPQESATITANTTQITVFHEKDLFNIAKLSRRWFGEQFVGGKPQQFNFTLPQIDLSQPVSIKINFGASSPVDTEFNVKLNNQNFQNVNLLKKGANHYASQKYFVKKTNINTENIVFNITYNNGGVPVSIGYLDYINITYSQKLNGFGKQFKINPNDENNKNVVQYNLSNANTIEQIWNVTDPYNISYIANNGSNLFSFKGYTDESFHIIDTKDWYTPELLANSKVKNQNLKGSVFKDGAVDYLIITRKDLIPAANKLAKFHKNYSNLNVQVVPIHLIYEEFSSGKQDIVAIRNFIRYVYKHPINNGNLKYINLLGDASYDYKDRINNNTNVVPVFQSLGIENDAFYNFNDWSCFMTDDFYGLMDDNEGNITNQNYTDIDLALGRMICNNLYQANALVDKIIQYHSKENSGQWKNNYIALADDVDSPSDVSLQESLENMVSSLLTHQPYFNFKKIYTDAYTQEVSAGGARYPRAKKDFLDAFNTGALIINYLGHGGNYGLSQERLLESSDINSLTNKGKYPLFNILTCEFTWFDQPETTSGGELLFLRKNAGAIALLATTRKIGISNANEFTKRISEYLFNIGGISSNNITIAEALRLTKNSFSNGEKAIVFYIGDPALKLSLPKPKINLTHINNNDIATYNEPLKALDLIKLSGNITDTNGNLLNNYNGKLSIQLFDKEIERETLGNDNVIYNGVIYKMKFNTLGETIYRGNASVINGKFDIEFIVPKDIKINVGKGKLSLYAHSNEPILNEYHGYNTEIKIGGVREDAPQDNTPPTIALYINDESFINGGNTNESPTLIAILEDLSGINTARGIGHDIVAILDNNETSPYVLNDYYETEIDNFRKGKILFPFNNLSEGKHSLKLKVWDTYNNMAEKVIEFTVSKNNEVELSRVLNYPNPLIDYTEFWFQHNRPNDMLQAQVQIFTISGKLIKTINQTISTDGTLSRDIQWDGKDDFGQKIARGTYIYKLKVKSVSTQKESEVIEKLVVL